MLVQVLIRSWNRSGFHGKEWQFENLILHFKAVWAGHRLNYGIRWPGKSSFWELIDMIMCPRLTKTSTMLRSHLTMWSPSWGEVYLEPNPDWQATTPGFGQRPAYRDRSRCATSRSVKPSRFWTPTAPPATSSRWTRIHFLIQRVQKNQHIMDLYILIIMF